MCYDFIVSCKFVYIDNFKGQLHHGNGNYTWSDGSIYEGDWIDGEMTGKGWFIQPLRVGVGIGQARLDFDRPESGLRNKSQA
ncbi:MORN domain protein [Medicago truncatula]|uniref:MORN domain protein n=1 Tax=Medicago truncatula TaxID=3880 RepID=A0A072V4I7_MEDTR|nr:MORN domain protein [Medicago truncatula]